MSAKLAVHEFHGFRRNAGRVIAEDIQERRCGTAAHREEVVNGLRSEFGLSNLQRQRSVVCTHIDSDP